MKRTLAKWVVGAVVLPAVVLVLRKQIFAWIDQNL
jgi:hypothetical protein